MKFIAEPIKRENLELELTYLDGTSETVTINVPNRIAQLKFLSEIDKIQKKHRDNQIELSMALIDFALKTVLTTEQFNRVTDEFSLTTLTNMTTPIFKVYTGIDLAAVNAQTNEQAGNTDPNAPTQF